MKARTVRELLQAITWVILADYTTFVTCVRWLEDVYE